MQTQQQNCQINLRFIFTITPLEIRSNSKIKSSHSKVILIKLGNNIAKYTQLNISQQIEVDVMYSKTLQKYCPIKGIIKIYDVQNNGTQMISCVGGFQTQQILNQGRSNAIIQKEMGSSWLKLNINVQQDLKYSSKDININQKISSQKQGQLSKKKSIQNLHSKKSSIEGKDSINSRIKTTIDNQVSSAKLLQKFLNKDKLDLKDVKVKKLQDSTNKSYQTLNNSLNCRRQNEKNRSNNKQFSGKSQIQILRQQLSDEKRKRIVLQQNLKRSTDRLRKYQIKIDNYENDNKMNINLYKRLLSDIYVKNNKLIIQIDEKYKKLSIYYNNKQLQKTIKQLYQFAQKKINEFNSKDIDDNKLYEDKQLLNLNKKLIQKQIKIQSLQKQLQQIKITLKLIKQNNIQINTDNIKLKQYKNQADNSIKFRDNKISILQKQNQALINQINNLKKNIKNSQLQKEQFKQEISNLNQVIQEYRQKYQDFKIGNNKTRNTDTKQQHQNQITISSQFTIQQSISFNKQNKKLLLNTKSI